MKYWDDMQSKWGFSDGDAVPAGVEVYREIYIKAVNLMARKLGSAMECYAYDRPGFHNWCIIGFRRIGNEEEDIDALADEKLQEAIAACCQLDEDLDGFVNVTVEPVDAWELEVEALVKTYEPQQSDHT